ncbi:WhiB family transcriptional regulator [Nocardia nova]
MTRVFPAAADHPVGWAPVDCTEDPDLFFSEKHADIHGAQRICHACPLLARCARFALAAPKRATDGVFASVLMPACDAAQVDREKALEQLRLVAASGEPAPLHDFSHFKFDGTREELQRQVVKLRDAQGMSWTDIGRALNCHYITALNIYRAAEAAALSEEVA